jgi:hypothetical protein
VLVGLVVVSPHPGEQRDQSPAVVASETVAIPSDEDGDGYADLAVGVPGEAPGLPVTAGAVAVLEGAPNGAPWPVTVWSQDCPGPEDSAEEWDHFWRLP